MTKKQDDHSKSEERRRIASMQPSPEDLQEPIAEPAGSIRRGSLAGKTMWAAIWFLAIPILIQQILVATVGLADKTGVLVHIPRQRQDRLAVGVLAAGHGQAHAEEDHPEAGRLHAVHQV